MSLEHFSRLSQSIKDAAESANPQAAKTRAAVSVNSIGSMSVPRRERTTAFDQAVDTLGNAIQAARSARLARTENKKEAGTEQPAKSLAELLAESAQDSE